MLAQRQQAPYFILYQPNMGTIARYHLDTAVIDQALEALRAQTDGISLSLWLMAGCGASDMWLDWKGGQLLTQPLTNLTALLAKIKALNFAFVQVALEFWGDHDPRKNPYTPQLLADNWTLIFNVQQALAAAGITNYLIDVCPEFNDYYPTNPDFQQYVKDLWATVTCFYYPLGEPCWAFTMSFIPTNWSAISDAFQGNPPVILGPHLYGSSAGAAAFLSLILTTYDQLAAQGLGDRLWGLLETDTVVPATDRSFAQALQSAIQQRKIRLVLVAPWQVVPSDAPLVNFSVYPPTFSPQWAAVLN